MRTKEQQNIYYKKWSEINKDRKKKYYLEHKEKITVYMREYWKTHKEELVLKVKQRKINGGWKPKTDFIYLKKICCKCKKESDNLVKHFKNKYGHQYYYCRDCNTERQKKYRLTDSGKLATRRAVKMSIDKYPEKQLARIIVKYNILKGRVVKSKICAFCKRKKVLEAHHKDYTKPLDVVWVCRQCHFMVK